MLRVTFVALFSSMFFVTLATGAVAAPLTVAADGLDDPSAADHRNVGKDVSPFDKPLKKRSITQRRTDDEDRASRRAKRDKNGKAVSKKDQAVRDQNRDDNDKEDPEEKGTEEKDTDKKDDANDNEQPLESKDGDPDDNVRSIASLRLAGTLPEIPSKTHPFGDQPASLREIIRRLDKAAQDDDIAGVLLELRGLSVGRGGIHELREAIRKTRQAGKRVYANLEMANPASYLVASACDEIRMPESGIMILPGVRAEIGFYKRLLKKLNVEADFLQVGDYKGAAEPMTRDSMSKQFRSQYAIVIDDMYEQMIETISQDRRLSSQQVKTIIDQGLFTASGAFEAGLIDVVAYDDEFTKVMKNNLQASEIKVVKDYGKKKVDNDFSGMMGLVKLMEAMMGGDASKRTGKAKKIAVVYAIGAITTGKSQQGVLGGRSMGSDTIIKALRKANDDDSVKAIVLRVNSPGGSALASDLIWRQIRKIEKPVVASMGDVAASGGYYISMGCDKIVADPGTITGSIGVVSGKLAVGKLFDKIGVTTEVISRGANSGMFTSQNKFTPSEREVMRKMMEEVYGQFTRKAAAGRDMKLKKLLTLAGGRIWTGRQAQSNGLVDRVGTLADAIATAQQLAGIDPDEDLPIIDLPKPKTLFEEMFGGADATATRSLQSLLSEVTLSQWQQLETLQKLFREPTVLVLPYTLEIH